MRKEVLYRRNKSQSGMTMLEVVVSMLVIGLGLAMSVSMIQRSTQFSDNAASQNIALGLMYDLVGSMRSNSSMAQKYLFEATKFSELNKGTNCTEGDYSETIEINACKRVNSDLKTWKELVDRRWPAGSAVCASLIKTADVTYGYTIELRWHDIHDEGNNPTTCADYRQSQIMKFTL